ncbi:aspartyl protease family protein At5g10770-like [Nymphaea colorata]|nr:aspartyl protease family protein At5g10770-like [Nymphaea colorata]
MTKLSLFSTLNLFLALFLCPGTSSFASAKDASHHYFQILAADILPSARSLCKAGEGLRSTYQQGRGALKLVHRHGPCSPFSGIGGSAANGSQLTLTEVLQQDQSRVQWIHSRASSSPSDNKQVQDPFQAEATTQLPARPGASLSTLNYVVTVGLGTPKQAFNLAFDTGSDLTWVQCEPCISCYPQQGARFNPAFSSTYQRVSCTAPECAEAKLESGLNQCSASGCLYGIVYGDNSVTVGQLSRDKLTLTGSDVLPGFTFGCGQKNQGIFGMVGGLLGLGRTQLSVVSQARNKYGGVFSYCLPTSNGVGHLTFGPDRSSFSSARFTPLLPHSKFYFVPLAGMSVGGRLLPVSPSAFGSQGTVLDSGTVITRLPPAAYSALRSAFRDFMAQRKYPLAPAATLLDTCYDLSSYTAIEIPKIAFHFQGGTDLVLNAANILLASSLSQVCLAFAGNTKAADPGIIGNWQQKTTLVVHDIPNSKIGFGQGACS